MKISMHKIVRKPKKQKHDSFIHFLLNIDYLGVIPNAVTLGNALCGFLSLVLTSNGHYRLAATCILYGALMDAVDGRIARYLGQDQGIGIYLDSLCDALSFCLAPSFLLYHWYLHDAGIVGFLVTAYFLMCGLIRLARFSMTSQLQTQAFIGMPTTLAGCFLATLLLCAPTIPDSGSRAWLAALLMLVATFATLMISSLRFTNFKRLTRKTYFILFSILTLTPFFALLIGINNVLLSLFSCYFLFVLGDNVIHRNH